MGSRQWSILAGRIATIAFFFGCSSSSTSGSTDSPADAGDADGDAQHPGEDSGTVDGDVNDGAVHPGDNDGIQVAYSTDGLNFTRVGEKIMSGRFVGSVVHDPAKQEFRIYHLPAPGSTFPDDAQPGSWIYMTGITSLKTDGSYELAPGTERDVGQQIFVDGVDPQTTNAEDPSFTLLSDGSYLLHYFENRMRSVDPMCFADETSEFVIGVATSSDGVHFTRQGTALQYEKLMDPEVFLGGDQRWHLLASNSMAFDRPIVSAVSDDGMSFEVDGTIDVANPVTGKSAWIPRVTELPGGGYRMYYNSPESPFHVYSAISEDGIQWESEDGIRLRNAGKTSVVHADGIFWAFYSYGGPDVDPSSEAGARQPSVCLDSSTTPRIAFLDEQGTTNHQTLMGSMTKVSPPPNGLDAAPAMVLDRLGNSYLFARDTAGTLYHASDSAPIWEAFDGSFSSRPTALVDADDEVHVFAQKTDGSIAHRTLSQPWQSLGSTPESPNPASAPQPVLGSDGELHVLVRTTDNTLWHRTLHSDWTSLGGSLAGEPSAVRAFGDTAIHVFARGPDGGIWHRVLECSSSMSQAESACEDWVSRGGNTADNPVVSDPIALASRLGEVPVFVIRADGSVWFKTQELDWTSIGGSNLTFATPFAGKDFSNYVFAVDQSGVIFYRPVLAPQINPWIQLAGNVVGSISVGAPP